MNSDEKYLNRCLEIARRGAGYVSPNPMVGAVLVKNKRIIGEGFHQGYGQPHAEVEAIKNAMEPVKGATLYCNLEPCCHRNKQTPPCVPLIISKGIVRVVISNTDPNPQVSGKGVQELKSAGIDVAHGLLNEQGHELNRFFFTFMKKKRPYIILKIAQSLDGKIAAANGQRTAITGSAANNDVHQLRSQVDAVLIGANTLNIDNPLLTVRNVDGRNPIRIVLDGQLNCNLQSKLFSDKLRAQTVVLASESVSSVKKKAFSDSGVRVLYISANDKEPLDLIKVLRFLYEEKLLSVMVEGGQRVFSQFIKQSLYDEIIIYQAPIILGNGVKALDLSQEQKVNLYHSEVFGQDVKMILHPVC